MENFAFVEKILRMDAEIGLMRPKSVEIWFAGAGFHLPWRVTIRRQDAQKEGNCRKMHRLRAAMVKSDAR